MAAPPRHTYRGLHLCNRCRPAVEKSTSPLQSGKKTLPSAAARLTSRIDGGRQADDAGRREPAQGVAKEGGRAAARLTNFYWWGATIDG